MRQFSFSEEVVAEIRPDRYHYPHPRVQRKLEVLWLKAQGLTHAAIATLADVSPRSVQRYLDEFEQGGLPRVRQLNWSGKTCALDAHLPSLEDYCVEHPPRSAREAQDAIERLTGIRRGLSQVRAFLKKKLGWGGGR
jgi:transposase